MKKQVKEIVQETIRRYQMIEPGDLVIIGLSGGPDSLALLHLLTALQTDLDFRLHAAHVDHSFRGKEAEEEARWVEKTALQWGVPCTLTKVNVPEVAREKGISSQEAGHLVRKRFFQELLQKLGAQKIALGHQADDQAETLLMHFLVGTGLEGLQGIIPVNLPLIRPLIFLRRAEIERYCWENALEPRRDPSNQKNVYLRNKIRNQVIPCLEERINPNLVDTLNRTASIIQQDEDYLQKAAEQLAQRFVQTNTTGSSLLLREWTVLHPSMQRRLIRTVFRSVGENQGLAFSHVEEVRKFMEEGQTGKVLQLPGGVRVEKDYTALLFYHESSVEQEQEENTGIKERLLKIPGETYIPETGQKIMAELVERAEAANKAEKIYFPWKGEIPSLVVRSRRPGDRISLAGLGGTKKLKAYFNEKKIPRRQRDRILLISVENSIIWIPALAVGGKFTESKEPDGFLALTIIKT